MRVDNSDTARIAARFDHSPHIAHIRNSRLRQGVKRLPMSQAGDAAIQVPAPPPEKDASQSASLLSRFSQLGIPGSKEINPDVCIRQDHRSSTRVRRTYSRSGIVPPNAAQPARGFQFDQSLERLDAKVLTFQPRPCTLAAFRTSSSSSVTVALINANSPSPILSPNGDDFGDDLQQIELKRLLPAPAKASAHYSPRYARYCCSSTPARARQQQLRHVVLVQALDQVALRRWPAWPARSPAADCRPRRRSRGRFRRSARAWPGRRSSAPRPRACLFAPTSSSAARTCSSMWLRRSSSCASIESICALRRVLIAAQPRLAEDGKIQRARWRRNCRACPRRSRCWCRSSCRS